MSGGRSFAWLLRVERRRAGLTQEQLFDRSGVAVRTISDLERGVAAAPQTETARRLAEGLALAGAELEHFLAAAGRGDPEALREPLVLQRVLIPPTALLGRGELVGQVAGLLEESAVRLVSLLGPGGVGKTRVAAAAAALAARRFPDGVADVDLAPVRDPTALVRELAVALGDEAGGTDVEALIGLVGAQRKLLLLDNFEQLVAGAPVLSRVLARCPQLKILCTSRIPLRIRGEHEVIVPPLALPGPHATAADIETCDAVRMFAAVARTRSAGWRVDERNAAEVVAICRAVDGIPLALELAASRVGALGTSRIAALLADRVDVQQLLSGGPRDLPERQHSVATTIDWSHDLLGADARALLRRLAVFPAEFSAAAAQEVCGESAALTAVPVMTALSVLDGASLLRRTVAEPEARYALYRSVREYAVGKLNESGEGDAVKAAYTAYVLRLGDRAAVELAGERQAAWLGRFEAANGVRIILMGHAAVEHGTRRHRLRPTTGALLARLVLARGEAVAVDRILRDIWPDRLRGAGPPTQEDQQLLQQCINELHKALDPDSPGRLSTALVSATGRSATYRLEIDPLSVDVLAFRHLIDAARFAYGDDRRELLRQAVGLWQGKPLIDAGTLTFAADEISELRQLHRDAVAELRDVSRLVDSRPAGTALVDVRRLPIPHHPAFRGREQELVLLDAAWWERRHRIVSVVAFGGEGKSTLVNQWLRRFIDRPDNGAGHIFAWSFYSQGSSDRVSSAGEFTEEALRFFGDPNPSAGTAAGRGERLAHLVRARRALLVLDGLEPLQFPPGSVRAGELKDRGLLAMLQNLAFATEQCLCVVTTRVPVTDLAGAVGGLVASIDLPGLSEAEAESLLRELGVAGPAEQLRAAGAEYAGHPLALMLLASYLNDRFGCDVRRRDMIGPLTEAPDRAGHARRVMQAYENWFADDSPARGARELLYLLGLFDRPAEPGVVHALRRTPVPGLNDQLVTLSASEYSSVLAVLRRSRLLPPDADHRSALDTHPLVREHFGQSLRRRAPEAWRNGNQVIYDHLVTTTPATPDTVEGLSPLYSAIYHGVRAERPQEALDVYRQRVMRGDEFFSTRVLGAVGDDLVALSSFFDRPFDQVTTALSDQDRAFVLKQTGYCLRACGRLQDAAECMSTALRLQTESGDLSEACATAGLIAHTYMTAGRLDLMLTACRDAVTLADRAKDPIQSAFHRSTLAYMLHQTGRLDEAEQTAAQVQPMLNTVFAQNPLTHAFMVFHQCDLLESSGDHVRMRESAERALATLPDPPGRLALGRALLELSLGRANLVAAKTLGATALTAAQRHLDSAVEQLHGTGRDDCIALALLARADALRIAGARERARADIDRTIHLAQRGGMDLYLADAHLSLATLLADSEDTQAARQALHQAREMIHTMGYRRRAPQTETLTTELGGQ